MPHDDVFPVIAERNRRRILEALRPGDQSVGELVDTLGVSQPTVSKHLKVLREAGLVTTRADGQRRYYSVDPVPLAEAAAWLTDFATAADPGASAPVRPAGPAAHSRPQGPANAAAVAPASVSAASARLVPRPASAAVPGQQVPEQQVPEQQLSGQHAPAQHAAPTLQAAPTRQAAPTLPAGQHAPAQAAATAAPPAAQPPTPAAGAELAPAARHPVPPASVLPTGPSAQLSAQQLGRTVGRTVEQVTGRAQDLLDRLPKPKFGRRR
ncbi:MAG: metalloregulator ArsR/SmtB family transcription factor [Arthrobacter sp.]|uniref:metalloregulator ArsR/SmtB family transcription factor n=1 Tax=Arthrobacter sp. TaxID=1667 RepID=UPI00348A2997